MDQIDRIENKLDIIDNKLDNHLGRLSKTETDVSWIKGYIKIIITVGMALLAGVITYIITILEKV